MMLISPPENIITSDEYAAHLEFLLASLKGEEANARLLAGLVAIALLRRMSGEHQVGAAYRILEAVESFGRVVPTPEIAAQEDVDEVGFSDAGRRGSVI